MVSGFRRETTLADSPVKIEVISGGLLRERGASNLIDIAQTVNGVEEVIACGVCFTNSLSVNGLPGAYTAILIDGAPIMGSLSSIYGLNGIPTGMIERVEVLRGPHSTLYGSEALAGVVNVITRSTETMPRLNLVTSMDSHGETATDLAAKWKSGKRSSGMVGGQLGSVLGPVQDQNGDGFADHIKADRISAYARWELKGKSNSMHPGQFDLQTRFYGENRRNGVLEFMNSQQSWKDWRGNDTVYGESILTRRLELFGNWELPVKNDFRLSFSASHHDQDSYYGADSYQANQQVYWADFSWNREWDGNSGKHQLVTGGSMRQTFYDDITVATETDFSNAPEKQSIPVNSIPNMSGEYFDGWSLLTGIRIDHYGVHGLIPAPRLSLKYTPGSANSTSH